MKAHPSQQFARSRERGMALLLVLAVVVILSILVTGLWQASQPSWDESTLSRARFQAGLLAESGANIASHPRIEPGDPALRRDYGNGRSYEARITTEGGHLLVNRLEEEHLLDTVRELFLLWGVDAVSAAAAADSLADWIDADSDPHANGAENAHYASLGYAEYPPNEAFTSLEQMLLVQGMEQVAKVQPLWRDYFTVYGDGLVDVNAAPADLLAAFFGVTEESAINLVATRNGDDGLVGTEDDYVLRDAGEVQAILGLSTQEWDEVSAYATLSGTLRRIESTGRVGDHVVRRIRLVQISGEGDEQNVTPVARLSR